MKKIETVGEIAARIMECGESGNAVCTDYDMDKGEAILVEWLKRRGTIASIPGAARTPPMSDTKRTFSGAVGRQYHLAVVEKKDAEITALRAAAEKARKVLAGVFIQTTDNETWINIDSGAHHSAFNLGSIPPHMLINKCLEVWKTQRSAALAALEEVLG